MYKITFILSIILLTACQKQAEQNMNESSSGARPPVSITNVSLGPMYQIKTYNAYSQYQKKEAIRSPFTGYVEKLFINPGDKIKKGQNLFVLQTQEARALINTANAVDSLSNYEGFVNIYAPKKGLINTINYREGALVQQGEMLADLMVTSSMVFIMNVPYEIATALQVNKVVEIILPDKNHIQATIGNQLPIANAATQVLSFLLHPSKNIFIPENLNVTVQIKMHQKDSAQRLPKQAILTNETQDSFWIMKLMNDSTAVKIPIIRGLETDSLVELVSPHFLKTDKILYQGQYGLSDTAYVKVMKP